MKQYSYKVKGVDYKVTINDIEGNIAKVDVNGIPFEVELDRPINVSQGPVSPIVRPVAPPAYQAPAAPAAAPAAPVVAGTGTAVYAPLPCTVNSIAV